MVLIDTAICRQLSEMCLLYRQLDLNRIMLDSVGFEPTHAKLKQVLIKPFLIYFYLNFVGERDELE